MFLNRERYLITPSLLNSWGYIWNCEDNVRESEKDAISFEDKVLDARQKAFEDFLKTLNRITSEPNEYMQAGIDFEEECYKGNTCVSPIIENGAFQISGSKDVRVNGLNILMYGRLDVLKGGIIYDIKRIWKYSLPKYSKSYQHQFYLELFPKAYKFEYLAFDGTKLHREVYFPSDNTQEIECVISQFLEWLKENDLYKIYLEKWRCKK